MLVRKINSKSHALHGDSLPDIMRWIERTPRNWDAHKSETSSSSSDWDMGAGWQGALELCRTGWREGGKAMNLVFDALPRAQGAAMSFKYNPAHGRFSLSKYLADNPNMFKRRVKAEGEVKSPIVYLAVNISAHGGTSATALHNYGAAVAAAVEALELSGARVQVDAYCVSTCGNAGKHRAVVGWNVKQAAESLNMAALAFSVAHPASLRRIMFALLERTPAAFEAWGYGMPTDILPSDLPDAPPQTVIINTSRKASSACRTAPAAVEAVQATINEAVASWRSPDS
jgi:hypothetical protein